MSRRSPRSGLRAPGRFRSSLLAPLLVTGMIFAPSAGAQVTSDTSGALLIGGGGQSATQTQQTQVNNNQGMGTNAGAITVGSPKQSNAQDAATNQSINQSQRGTFVVFNGALKQTANQDASTVLDNNQQINGSTIVGSPKQSNSQKATTNQSIDQEMDGTFVVLGGTVKFSAADVAAINAAERSIASCLACAAARETQTSRGRIVGGNMDARDGTAQSSDGVYIVFGDLNQTAREESSTTLTNKQSVSGAIIIGNPQQGNTQEATTNQRISQKLKGTFVVFGSLTQSAEQKASTVETNDQQVTP